MMLRASQADHTFGLLLGHDEVYIHSFLLILCDIKRLCCVSDSETLVSGGECCDL